MNEPSDIAQEALDAALLDLTVSDIEDGTREAQLLARKYRPCLASLLRSARWQFARKQQQMQILGDVTGTFTTSTLVIQPWFYEYALPNDCVQAHFVPYNPPINSPIPTGNIGIPNNVPLVPGFITNVLPGVGLRPARFLIARDVNYPPTQGQNWWEVQGQSPMGQTVVLTNVPQAQLVYTSLVLTPSEWDVIFREAMVAYLASEICVLHKDKRIAMAVRKDQIALAKAKILEARIADGNEGINVNDHVADWTKARMSGGGFGFGNWGNGFDGGGPGYFGLGYSGIAFADGGAAY